jgi:hypothetical protein
LFGVIEFVGLAVVEEISLPADAYGTPLLEGSSCVLDDLEVIVDGVGRADEGAVSVEFEGGFT